MTVSFKPLYEIRFGSGRNLDMNRNSGFGSGKTWNFSFGRNFGSKVNRNLGFFNVFFNQNLWTNELVLYESFFLSAYFPCTPFKVQYTVCIVCKFSSVSVPVPVLAHVCFRFRFRFQSKKSSSGSAPVPVDKSVPVDHYQKHCYN